MDRKQEQLARAYVPDLARRVKGYDVVPMQDICLAWEPGLQPGGPERIFLFRTAAAIYYALVREYGGSEAEDTPGKILVGEHELELLSRNQARELWRRLPGKIASEEEAFPTPRCD